MSLSLTINQNDKSSIQRIKEILLREGLEMAKMNHKKVSRRSFIQHTGSAVATVPMAQFLTSLKANAASVQKKRRLVF